jgi:hypothetical protein
MRHTCWLLLRTVAAVIYGGLCALLAVNLWAAFVVMGAGYVIVVLFLLEREKGGVER